MKALDIPACMVRRARTGGLVLAVATLSAACRGQTVEEPPIVPIRNMYNQPRYNAQESSPWFRDGKSMRPLVAGTIAQEMEPDMEVSDGRTATPEGESWVVEVPEAVVEEAGDLKALAQRGKDRYTIYCTPCHASSGNGQGMVTKRLGPGVWTPPTLHSERLRHIPDGQLYATITNGIRNMPAYKHSIPLRDRWAIVAYVRALQLAQYKPDAGASGAAGQNAEAADANHEGGAKSGTAIPDKDTDGAATAAKEADSGSPVASGKDAASVRDGGSAATIQGAGTAAPNNGRSATTTGQNTAAPNAAAKPAETRAVGGGGGVARAAVASDTAASDEAARDKP